MQSKTECQRHERQSDREADIELGGAARTEKDRRRFLKEAALVAGTVVTAGLPLRAAPGWRESPLTGAQAATKTRIIIVYASDGGTTAQMAASVADGARSVEGAEVMLKRAEDVTMADARTCDGMIIGSPVRHRNMHHRVKKFVEDVLERIWLTDEMVGKVGGVFTVGGGHGNVGAGAEMAQLGLLSTLAANGMVLVTLPKSTPGFDVAGLHWGPAGRTGAVKMMPIPQTDDMLLAGYHHGANVARVAAALRGKPLLATGNVAPSPDVLRMFQQAPDGMSTK